ncbi:DUF6520 family protein [Salegentibacter sp. HM20]
MKNLKFLLPMLAIVFAIGVAFTAPGIEEKPEAQAFDYYLVDGNWVAVDEQNCTGTGGACRVQVGTGGPIYELYDEMDDENPKPASVNIQPILINP